MGVRETSMYEGSINQLPPVCTPTGDRTGNLGVCPDHKSNPPPFSAGNAAQPAGQGLQLLFLLNTAVC